MAASVAAISPLSPGSKLDGWETPAPSLPASPVPTKCCDLPDYDPATRRNHYRSKDSQWNTDAYPKPASPLVPVVVAPPRPKPVRLATPNTGYPFPYVLSRPTTPLEPPTTTSRESDSSSSSSSGSSNDSQPLSSSFSDSSPSSSACSTPRDDAPQGVTPHEVQHRRTKNAASTPGAPPPMGFIGTGHANSFVDYEDVKAGGREDDDEATPKKLVNPLLAKLSGLATVDA
ncbi:hypothetical protein JCM11491_004533 [Sporobolomyces phaffii]